MNYQKNRLRAQTKTTKPSLTDQSQASETDVNVIVRKMRQTGVMPTASTQPMGGDFTSLPDNLRDMIELSRTVELNRNRLPPELRKLEMSELLALTPDKLAHILAPPQKADDAKKEETK